MIVENDRDQCDRQHQTGDDAKPEFEPHRKERDLTADALSLAVAAIKIVRKDGQRGAEKQLKHGSAPRSWQHRLSPGLALPQQPREPCFHLSSRYLASPPLRRPAGRRRFS